MTERKKPLIKENGPPARAPHFLPTEDGRAEEIMAVRQLSDDLNMTLVYFENEDGALVEMLVPTQDYLEMIRKDA